MRDQGRADPRRAARARPGARGRRADQPGAGHPARQPGLRRPGQRRARAAGRARAGRGRRRPLEVDAVEAQARALVEARRRRRAGRADAVDRRRRPTVARRAEPGRGRVAELRLPRGRAAAAPRPATRSTRRCTPWTAATSRPVRPGRRCAGLVNVLPTGRNFYSVDPKAIPSRLAYQTGQAMAESLLQRHLDETGELPAVGRAVGLGHLGDADLRRRHRRGAGPARRAAGLGRGLAPGRRAGGRSPLAELGRPRIDVTVRISGFFRDAFPHVVAMLDDAVRLVAELDEPAEQNYVRRPRRRPTWPSTATSGGPPPGSSAPSPARTAPASCR